MYKVKYLHPQPRTGPNTVLHFKLWAGLTFTAKVFDYSLNSNIGTVTGTSCLPAYPGFDFDGSADYIRVTSAASLSFGTTTDFTIKASFKTSSAATQRIISKKSATIGFDVYITTGKVFTIITDGVDTVSIDTGVVGEFSDGKWHRLMVAFDRDATMKIYVDGVLEATSASIAAVGDIDNANDLGVGISITAGGFFNGQLDDAMIFNRLLSAAEAKSDHAITHWRYGI